MRIKPDLMDKTMITMIKTAAFSAVVTLTAMTGLTGAAQAGQSSNVEFGIYVQNGAPGSSAQWDTRRSDNRRYDDRRYDDRRDNYRRGNFCTAGRALDKADRMGLYRARIVDEGRRTITVAGRKRGERIIITFGREPSCPILR